MLKLRRSAMESAAGWRNTSDWLRKQEEEKEKEEKQEASGLKLRQSVIDEFGLGTEKPQAEGDLGDFLDLLLDPLNTAKEGIEDVGTTTGNFLEQQKYGWFQKGAFERGEIGKGIAASGLDAAENVGGGFLDTGESFLDWLVGSALPGIVQGQYYQNGGGYNIQADQIAEQQIKATQPLLDEFVQKDLYDGREVMKQGTEWLGGLMDIDVQQDSVFGDKMDSLLQSGGQMLGTTALSALTSGGVPWWVTTGATAWGSEMENALNQGATHAEANFSGMMSGAAEVLTEMISGGIKFGKMGTLDDGMTKLLARSITNKFWRNATKVGLDILGEGTEEVLSEAIGRFGQWMSYQDDKTLEEMLLSEEAADSYITAFLGGAIMGGFGSGVQQVKSAVSGVDAVTGLTKNEQAVVDRAYREAVAQAETQGKVTEKQRAELYDSVLEQIETLRNEPVKPIQQTTFEEQTPASDNVAEQMSQDTVIGIKEQLHRSQTRLNTMDPVADIRTPIEFPKMSLADKMNWVVEKLRPTNYKVDRKGFGIINFSAKQLKSAFNYFTKGGVEEAAFEAMPYVLENGTQIFSRPSHKDRGYGTVTFAAPVTINGKRGNMAVAVKRTTDNFYKVHRILAPDGSVFEFSDIKKAEPTPAGESPKNGSLATPISPAFADIITGNDGIVNGGVAVGRSTLRGEDVALAEQAPESGPSGRPVPTEGTVEGPVRASGEVGNASEYEALFPSEEDLIEAEVTAMDDEYRQKAGEEGYSRTLYDSAEGKAVDTVGQRLQVKHQNLQWELEAGQRNRQQMLEAYDKKIASVQAKYDAKTNKNTKIAQGLLRQIQRLQRLKSDRVAEWDKRLADIQSRLGKVSEQMQQDHSRQDRLETVRARIDRHLEADLAQLQTDFDSRRNGLTEQLGNKTKFIKDRAMALYQELQNLKKGVKASSTLGFLKDSGLSWSQIKQGLATVYQSPTLQVNKGDTVESAVREVLLREYTEAEGQLQQLDKDLETQRQALQEKAAQEKEAAGVAHQRKTKQGEYAQEVAELAGDTSTWKDKKMGISYMVNTLRRNLREVVRDAEGNLDIEKADAIYDYLQGSYSRNEAELKRESRRIKSPYKDLHLTKAEDAYVQMLGEVRHNPDTSLNPLDVEAFYEAHKDSIDKAKVDKAIEMARKTYDELLQRVNEVLSAQGMKEIPYRKGYFPHFTEEKNGFLARLLNWKAKNNEIPTDIAGLTEQFNPNRSWQSFNKRRMSDTTDYSFTKGMDTYVQGALDWIYHIEDIQRRRAFENHIRYVHSDEGIQEKIDAAVNSHQYDADQLQEEIDSILKEAGNPLNNLVTDLRTGTNLLAGKKSSMDRGMEQLTSRKAYSAMTNISNRVSANMVGGSISSALTNFIPITQSWGQVSPISSLKALGQVIRNAYRDDGTVDKSTFLTNRLREDEKLYQSGWDKAGNVVNWLSGLVDSLTAQTVWRSKYMENLEAGMSENAAIRDADQFAENVIAGRSRGETPTIFGSKNPVTKLLTAFQLEVANQYGYMLKDMPQDLQKEAKGKLVAGYAKMFVGAYAYNALFSALTGRDAAFDPIRILEGLLGDLGVPGTMELLTGADDEEKEEPLDAMMGFAEDIAEEIPFIGGLLGGGRVPISSALPYEGDVMDTIEGAGKLLLEGDLSQLRELENPMYYLLPPMAGGQLRKTVQGLGMFYGDHPVPGSYTDSGDLRFTVEDNFFSKLKAGIFGQWASENAQAYIEEGRKPLSQQQTQELLDTGMTMDEYWTYRDGLKGLSTLAEKADYINGLDLTTEQKNILINNIADREDPIDMESYEDFGSFAEFDYAIKNPEKYAFLEESGIGYAAYAGADEEGKRAYTWAYDNPGKFAIAQAVSQDFMTFYSYKQTMSAFESDMDEDGNTISGSKKEKVIDYINSLDLEYGQKILLYRMMYDSQADKDTYNMDIIDYLNSREDISYEAMETILIELGFQVDEDGNITWD